MILSVSTGRELAVWLQAKLRIETEAEALNLANMLARLGYLIPVTERALLVKPDTCLRIQVYLHKVVSHLLTVAAGCWLFSIYLGIHDGL